MLEVRETGFKGRALWYGMEMGIARRIIAFLRERVSVLDDPRAIGKTLKGSELGEFWKYRVGDWRLICQIEDPRITITVVRLGNRREVYR